MRTAFEQRALETIQRSRLILPGSRVGLAVSGGADSVALLRIFESLANELGITLVVAHLNHSLRGPESDADAAFVETLARERNLRVVSGVENVAAAADREGWNLEDAGRRLRREFFERLIEEDVVDLIAVAHTADDQAETLLAHIMRGTGMTGLGGIYPAAPPIVRPLLEMRRQELREYLRSLGQNWREDLTNHDTQRMRARIRKELLPLIERDFSTGIVGHLNELARLAREEEAFWNALVEERFQALMRKTDEGLVIGTSDLLAPLNFLHNLQNGTASEAAGSSTASPGIAPTRSVTERLIRRLYEAVRGDRRELSASHVEQVIDLAGHLGSGRAVQLPRGIVVRREFNELVFARVSAGRKREIAVGTAESVHSYQYAIGLPLGKRTIFSVAELGKQLSLNLIDWPIAQSDTIRDTEALDADLLRAPLILRNWRPGDSYRPRGRREARKLKEMMLGVRVPAGKRGIWPVLESAGQVVWALGMVPANDYLAGPETRKGLLIVEEKG
jgi:tRNA(Ile)-lysidine synthase